MNLIDIVNRTTIPTPWTEGEKIPWNEPGFSARMLKEHLSQEHDAASRRFEIIDRQVEWIHGTLLQGRPARVLDLGCGPGLYASRLARRGCACMGIDFSPASIAYAIEQARKDQLDCTYLEGDVRRTPFGEGYDLAMFIFGEFNTFHPKDARLILEKACAALKPGGWLLLEPHPFEAVREIGQASSNWYSSSGGLFSPTPHIYLEENFWDEASATATIRNIIVDAQDGSTSRYACTMQAYSLDQFRALLEEAGFKEVEFMPSLGGMEGMVHYHLMGITARK